METLICWKGRVHAVVIGETVRVTSAFGALEDDGPDALWVLALIAQARSWPREVTWDEATAARAARRSLAPATDVVGAWSAAQDLRSFAAALGVPWEVALARLFDRDVAAVVSVGGRPGRVRGPRPTTARRSGGCPR